MEKTKKPTKTKSAEKKAAPKKEAGAAAPKSAAPLIMVKVPPRLRETFREKVLPALMKEFSYQNPMQVPRLDRIVLNVGMGEAIQNVKLLESAATELGAITGQRPVITRAKKAIAGFKLRQGMPIGAKVTLRSDRMYEFFDRLVNVALPRIRDFKGVSPKAFDGRGNFTLGLKEQLIFPEVEFDKMKKTQGMDVTFVTSAEKDEHAKRLLELLGLPFRKRMKGNQ